MQAPVGHLLRRAGFGPRPDDLDAFAGLTWKAAVDRVLAELDATAPEDPKDFDAYEPGAIQDQWLNRMISGEGRLAERLAFFWHGHFATSNRKVQDPALMWSQYRLFRSKGGGTFTELVGGVCKDVAMIRWLDGNANRKGVANENYARELQELFTLGIGNYTEQDVREAARAFTGWASRHHKFVFKERFHDHGDKTFHGHTGDLDGDDVAKVLCELPACHTFIATKLLRFFTHPEPVAAEVREVADVLAKTGSIRDAMRTIFMAPGFVAKERRRALVKSPVEFAVGVLRLVGAKTAPIWVHGALERMGQILFRPPSVKGWTSGAGWLGSAAVVERLRLANKGASLAPEEHADVIIRCALDDELTPELATASAAATGKDKIALALGSPEFQLA